MNVIHESPLNVVGGWTEALRSMLLDEEEKAPVPAGSGRKKKLSSAPTFLRVPSVLRTALTFGG